MKWIYELLKSVFDDTKVEIAGSALPLLYEWFRNRPSQKSRWRNKETKKGQRASYK